VDATPTSGLCGLEGNGILTVTDSLREVTYGLTAKGRVGSETLHLYRVSKYRVAHKLSH